MLFIIIIVSMQIVPNYPMLAETALLMPECPAGPPPQWRPMLEVASKAHLSPIILIGRLLYATPVNVGIANSTNSSVQVQQSYGPMARNGDSANDNQQATSATQFNGQQVAMATFEVVKIVKNSLPHDTKVVTPSASSSSASVLSSSSPLTANSLPSSAIVALTPTASSNTDLKQQQRHQDHNDYIEQLMPGRHITLHFVLNNARSTNGNNLIGNELDTNNLDNLHHNAPVDATRWVPLNGPNLHQKCPLMIDAQTYRRRFNQSLSIDQNQRYILFLTSWLVDVTQQHKQRHHLAPTTASAATSTFSTGLAPGAPDISRMRVAVRHPSSLMPNAGLIQFSAYTIPELLTKSSGSALRKILCHNCAKVPTVHMSAHGINATSAIIGGNYGNAKSTNVRVDVGNKLTLECWVDGFPTPRIQWFRNGRLMRVRHHNGRNKQQAAAAISASRQHQNNGKQQNRLTPTGDHQQGPGWTITTTKSVRRANDASQRSSANLRVTRLTFDKTNERNDTGYYECRAMNVVAREPSVGRFRLFVTPPSSSSSFNGGANRDERRDFVVAHHNLVNESSRHPSRQPHVQVESTLATYLPPIVQGGSSQQAVLSSQQAVLSSQQAVLSSQPTSTETTPNLITTIDTIDHSNNRTQVHERPIAPPIGRPCPQGVNEAFCLNNGTCTYLENIRESICICAAGYVGLRCEFKSIKSH